MTKEAKVKVHQGWLEGEVRELISKDGHFFSFKSIPYAEPPTGSLRFKAPKPAKPWNGVRQAKEHGGVSPQLDIFTNEFIKGDEDCLFLNVYTPEIAPKQPHPVMVFIHGGGFKSGSGNELLYAPDFLLKHGVILVTINYRVDALGFLCLDTEEVPGNAGLKDQVLALKWVRDNISSFGGDPKNVTIFGESAGGASVALQILSPLSKGLFQRAISMSGTPFCDWSIPYEAKRRAFVLGKDLGCNTDDPKVLLEFLQSLPVDKLVSKNPHVLTAESIVNNLFKMFPFTPVIEKDFGLDHFLTESVVDCLKNGKVNEVDVMIGFTEEESLVAIDLVKTLLPDYDKYSELFVPRKIQPKISPTRALQLGDKIRNHYFGNRQVSMETLKEFATYLTDVTFVYDILKYLNYLPDNGKKRYCYEFTCNSERNIYSAQGAAYNAEGSSHLEDLVYLFPWAIGKLELDKNAESYELIKRACTLFTNFAKCGNPTPDNKLGVTWHQYDTTNKHYLDIGNRLAVKKSPRESTYEFWDGIYAEAEK